MTGVDGRQDPQRSESDAGRETPPASIRPPMSRGLFNALTLVLLGASVGVFWREVFQLTIRAIEAFR